MRTVFFIPPLARMSGGLATLYRMADTLAHLGHDVALTSPGEGAAGFAEARRAHAALPWEGLRLASSDLWCVPESWPNAIAVGAQSGVRTLVYAQSWNFLLTTLPGSVRWKDFPVLFAAVSHPVSWFMREALELETTGILPPVVAPVFFRRGERPANRVRIAWMPRKNRALAEQMRGVAEALLAKDARVAVEWVEVRDLSQEEVARCFASCHIFLCAAFPEGFGLPPLEAMASGCVPVGFTGFGGWEYMRPFASRRCTPHIPPFVLPEKPWGANGLFFADGDTMAAGFGLAEAARMALAQTPEWLDLQREGESTAAEYAHNAHQERLSGFWERLATMRGA